MCFVIFQNEITFFQALKTRSLRSRKIEIFSKGLVHGFWPKLAIFPCFLFKAIQARKMCFTIFQNEETFFRLVKQEVQKVKKLRFFQRGQSMVFGQNWLFFYVFFNAISVRKMCFTICYNEKTVFQALKRGSSKSRKIEIFSKGLVHGFRPKLAIFPCFLLRQYRPGKCVLGYSRKKKQFLGFKNHKFKKSKN